MNKTQKKEDPEKVTPKLLGSTASLVEGEGVLLSPV